MKVWDPMPGNELFGKKKIFLGVEFIISVRGSVPLDERLEEPEVLVQKAVSDVTRAIVSGDLS